MSIPSETKDLRSGRSQRGARNQQGGRAGEYFVAAELNKRNVYAVTFAGNMPNIDVVASKQDLSRTVYIQVKTKRRGNWHTRVSEGSDAKPCINPKEEVAYWIFVDLGESDSAPRYWIVPDSWIRYNIYEVHKKYVTRHGGQRPGNPDSNHHSINEERLNEWEGRWDILDVF